LFIGKYFLWLLYRLGILTSNVTPKEMIGQKPEKYPIKLSNIQAMLGLRQLERINSNIEHRRQIAKMYEKILKHYGVKINQSTAMYNAPYIRYAFLVRDKEKLKEIFRRNQIELGEWFNSPIHPKGSSFEKVYYNKGSCPVAEFLSEHCVNLPTHPKIRIKDVERIINVLINVLKNSREILFLPNIS
jgi:dTDP-4-amino-4,6-dideoxygalactose transaminase